MGRFERFHILTCAGLLLCLVGLGLLLASPAPQGAAAALDKALERQIADQARIDFLHKLYRPVEELRAQGQNSVALLKLDELARQYPQEAHGEILSGELLLERGAVAQAIEHYVRAVRLNGDYVEQGHPLNRRQAIEQLVVEQLPLFRSQAQQDRQSLGLQQVVRGLYYLQSRLAGGCE